jgi:hypothetical protein
MKSLNLLTIACRLPLFLAALLPLSAAAWDYEGHRIVNQIALASLPKDFPEFVREPVAAERIAFLSGEPDRWRNTPDTTLKHVNEPDHFFDLEDLAPHGLAVTNLTPFRHLFTVALAEGRKAHPAAVPPVLEARNQSQNRHLIGFLPWALAEQYAKLKSGFSYLKAFEENGTPEEIANARQNIIHVMGVMGHFAGDAAQPLHTTRHYNGWVGPNPRGYATNTTFHSWIDGGFNNKVGLKLDEVSGKVRPAKSFFATVAPPTRPHDVFPVAVAFIVEQHKTVEPLYQLNKAGKLSGEPGTEAEGRAFIAGQVLKGGQFLGDLWLTAWKEATPDTFLRGQLLRRKATGNGR